MLELIESQDMNGLLHYITVRLCIVLGCWLFVVASNLIDFWSGTSTAKAIGEKLESHGFRRTVTKIGDYVRLLMFALMFDTLGSFLTFYKLPFASMLCTCAIIWIECKSVIENSRKKKAHAADVPDIVKQIVQSATTKQGLEILSKIQDELSKTNNKK